MEHCGYGTEVNHETNPDRATHRLREQQVKAATGSAEDDRCG